MDMLSKRQEQLLKFSMINNCPVCGSTLVRKDEEALPGLIYIVKDKIVLGVFKII